MNANLSLKEYENIADQAIDLIFNNVSTLNKLNLNSQKQFHLQHEKNTFFIKICKASKKFTFI